MKFDPEEYIAARADYERNWHVLDGTLYEVSRRFRSHANRANVCGKLWLIGRTYASGIERLVRSKGTQGSSLICSPIAPPRSTPLLAVSTPAPTHSQPNCWKTL